MATHDGFQRLLAGGELEVLSLNAQAALGPVIAPERSQFSHLLRHFIERFFNHETAAPDGDAKTRMVQIACAAGLPGFLVAIYLWPVYHPFRNWPPGNDGSLPSYWLQVNHHFFFVLYSFVAMAVATVFEWDLFFPDLLDIFVLGTLPVADRRVFLARVAAISVFVFGFLCVANVLAPIFLPMATDPPDLPRFLAGHVLAVAGSGLFAAALILASQGVLLSVLGERLMRKISLLVQGLSISAMLMLLLLFPVLSGVVPVLLQSGNEVVHWLPPFWFLGIYQLLLDGHAALPIYTSLAQTGCVALIVTVLLVVLTYPIAYVRRVRQLVEGPPAARKHRGTSRAFGSALHGTVARSPIGRAVFHFIGQTLMRVPRYRIYLVLYGGVGLAVVLSGILRFTVEHQRVHLSVSSDGIRAALGIIAFWVIAGLRMAFVSPGNQRGNWAFDVVHGKPPQCEVATEEIEAAQRWVLLCSLCLTAVGLLLCLWFAPPQLRTPVEIATQLFVSTSLCLLLTDGFFLQVTMVPFTGRLEREKSNLALTVLKYFTFFPLVATLPVVVEPWIVASVRHFLWALGMVVATHLLLERQHRAVVKDYANMPALEDDEEDFPMKLGLRY